MPTMNSVQQREQTAPAELVRRPGETRMRMLYGVNQADQCWDFAVGPDRERTAERLREIDTRMIRLFLFDKGAPDPVKAWPLFAAYVNAVLNVGATPMITFAKFHRPFDDPRALRWFANQCGDVVWNCIEQWGPDAVKNWYWCVWNEPNSDWIGGGLSFEKYREIYEAIAAEVVPWLEPHLGGQKPLLGGPAVEGFQPFWMDWVWRFVNEIDNSLIGFVDWHCYGDWREHGERGAPLDPATHRALMMSQTPDYEARCRTIARHLRGRNILNICGELNTHSHYWTEVRERFNYSVFSAAFYTSAVLHLMRGGADAEMFWTGTEDKGGYGMMNKHGDGRPVFHAKRLCAQHIRRGDWVSFRMREDTARPVDVAMARGDDGQRSVLVVHLQESPATYELSELVGETFHGHRLLKIDAGTSGEVLEQPFDGTLRFDGHGVAVVTNAG